MASTPVTPTPGGAPTTGAPSPTAGGAPGAGGGQTNPIAILGAITNLARTLAQAAPAAAKPASEIINQVQQAAQALMQGQGQQKQPTSPF